MHTLNYYGYALDLYKNAVNTSFEALITCTAQSAISTEKILASVPSVPEEGKKVASIYFGESQRGLAILRKHMESTLELDWTAKDAPLKNLEALEAFSKDVFKESAEIQKEMKPLVKKATEQLPKETKEIIELSSKVVNSGTENLQKSVTEGFKAAQKTLTDVYVTGKKAAK